MHMYPIWCVYGNEEKKYASLYGATHTVPLIVINGWKLW